MSQIFKLYVTQSYFNKLNVYKCNIKLHIYKSDF